MEWSVEVPIQILYKFKGKMYNSKVFVSNIESTLSEFSMSREIKKNHLKLEIHK